ncbi:MAG: ABC transporter ATP-binding protein/permease [bacterium]|nr:ABC transporter ATP-binding protein/permease [bacterium]
MHKKNGKNPSGHTASAWDVIKAFWYSILNFKLLFSLSVIFVIVANAISIYAPLYYRDFFNIVSKSTDRASSGPELMRIIFMILFLNGLIWISYRINAYCHIVFQAHAMAKLKQNAFNYMIEHSYMFFANSFTGTLVQRVNRYARAFERLTDRFIYSVLPILVQVIGIGFILWFINPVLTFIILGLTFSFLLFNYVFSVWKLKYDLRMTEADSKATGYISDVISNQNTVSLFTAYNFEKTGYKRVTKNQADASSLAWNLNAIVQAFQSGFIFIAEFALFYYAIIYWQQGVIDVGTLVLIQVYFLGLGAKLWELSRIVRDIYEGFADAKEMIDIMKLPHEIKDIPAAVELNVTNREIEFKNIEFSFNQTRSVLNNINLIIKGGERIALIGPSGAGKSTFIRLILRFYEVTAGEILIDGQNIREVTLNSLRKNISYVPQEPILFHRSLKENIRYGRRDATDNEVQEAARLAHCEEFIKNLPLTYDTLVGERGIKLSGGERQRIAIARAILKNAPILILDEATSSLDSGSEHLIQDALDVLMKDKTVIVIAHRLSTIRKMDRIVVIDNGQVTEQGTHDELLQIEGSLYSKLWNLQAGGFLKEEEEKV